MINEIYHNKKLFEEAARKIHGDQYDYSKFALFDSTTPGTLICKCCGNKFTVRPWAHLYGSKTRGGVGCPICANRKRAETLNIGQDGFLKKLKTRIDGGTFYDYSQSIYVDMHTNVKIICPIHGEFFQTPDSHISHNSGCPVCNQSKLEEKTREVLKRLGINFIQQQRFPWLGHQSLDFYLPDYNIAIECQGIQHYKPVPMFNKRYTLEHMRELDKQKRQKCHTRNISIRYVKYTETNIEARIKKILNME